MSRKKRKKIEERITMIEKNLVNAAAYVAKGVNIEVFAELHFGDWRGNSGHPVWMKNVMIPRSIKWREKLEKTLLKIDDKAKDKKLTMRKRRAATSIGMDDADRTLDSMTSESSDQLSPSKVSE